MDTWEDHGPGVSEDIPILPSGGTWIPLKDLRQGGSLPPVSVRPSSSFQFCFHGVGRLFLGALCFCVSLFCSVDLLDRRYGTDSDYSSIDHFKDVRGRANNLSVEVRKRQWQVFCSSEWPAFNVGWPPEGTFHLPTIHRVRGIISWPKTGHPDQLPYIITWQDLVEDPPSWLKPFLDPRPPDQNPFLLCWGQRRRRTRKVLPSLQHPSTLSYRGE